jgi:hypothetical protein
VKANATVTSLVPLIPAPIDELLAAPVSHPKPGTPDGFFAKGCSVRYWSIYRRRFEDGDAVENTLEQVLLYTMPMLSNRGEMVSAAQVARRIASILNKMRQDDLAHRGVRCAV